MRPPVLPPSILLYILSSTTPTHCMIDLDFSAYPASTQACLEDAAGTSGCTGDTVAEVNQCLCGNTGNFVLNTAACIKSQGSQIVGIVWDLLQESCSNTKTPLKVSEASFLASGSGTKVTSTATTTASNEEIVASARIGAITASVAGTLFIACVVCLVILLGKRKRDKELLRRAQEAAGYTDRDRGPDKPLLNPGDVTPGPMGPGGPGYERTLAASVAPPTPSYAGPISPQVWRSWPQATGQGATTSPSELDSDHHAVGRHDDLPQGHMSCWPSPLSQGVGTMGTWCPSPLSAVPSSNVLGMYGGGTSTIGALSTLPSPLSREITGTMITSRSSWAHNRHEPDELYELPGSEVRCPVEADSIPVFKSAESFSTIIDQAPPEYSAGGWNDPITDKPPTWI